MSTQRVLLVFQVKYFRKCLPLLHSEPCPMFINNWPCPVHLNVSYSFSNKNLVLKSRDRVVAKLENIGAHMSALSSTANLAQLLCVWLGPLCWPTCASTSCLVCVVCRPTRPSVQPASSTPAGSSTSLPGGWVHTVHP